MAERSNEQKRSQEYNTSTVSGIAKLTQSLQSRRIRMALIAVSALCVYGGSKLANVESTPKPLEISEQLLDGDWELQAVNGYAVGPQVQSVILSQKVHFEGGRIQGETHVRADSDAATTSMPFPDQSVNQVKSEVGSSDVTATWTGTYHILDGSRIELTIGNATYRAQISPVPSAHEIIFDHDAILTYKGPARYRYVPHSVSSPNVYF